MTQFWKHDPIIYQHLLNHPFDHGKRDCYTIPVKLFADNTPITLTDYARPNDWWLGNANLYIDNFRKEGFKLIDEPLDKIRILDCFLIAIPDNRDPSHIVTNHCAVYVGEGKVVHHRLGDVSRCVPYRGWLREYTTHTVRHQDVPELKVKSRTEDLMDYILPHKRALLQQALDGKL